MVVVARGSHVTGEIVSCKAMHSDEGTSVNHSSLCKFSVKIQHYSNRNFYWIIYRIRKKNAHFSERFSIDRLYFNLKQKILLFGGRKDT